MWKNAIDIAKRNQPIATTGIVPHIWYWLFSSSGDRCCSNPSYDEHADSSVAIYFIHGTFDQTGAFEKITRRLLKAGLPKNISDLIILSFTQRYQGASIECYAEQLKQKITANNHKKVILMGHSRGGLVASYFAEFLAASASIEVPYIITLGTPFNGSYLASRPISWFSESVEEMRISSVFLNRLKEKILKKSQSTYHFVVATQDFVVPEAFGYIDEYVEEHPESLTILKRHAHLSIMSSHYLVHQIACMLRTYENTTNSEVSCMEPCELIENYFSAP